MPDIVVSILPAVVIFTIFTVMFRRNIWFTLIQNFVIAVIMAQGVATSVTNVYKQIWTPMVGGQWILIIAFLLSLAYFMSLSKRFINIYRFVFMLGFTIGVGTLVTTQLKTAGSQLIGMSDITHINQAIYLLFFIAALAYFTFSRRLEKPLRHVRTLGLAVILMWAGAGVATMQTSWLEAGIGWQIIIIQGPGVYVIAIIALGILLDILGVWRALGLTGRKEEATLKT